jgi:hypothetical protein
MELLSIRTARFIGAISTSELNPRGLLVYPTLIDGLVERYGFLVAPDENAVFDEEAGIVFEDGAWNNVAIDKVTIFTDGIVIDTRSTTKDSEAIFEEALTWAAASYGLTYKPEMVSRRVYVSEIVFRTQGVLGSLNAKLDPLAERLSGLLKQYSGFAVKHEVTSIGFHYDHTDSKFTPASFRVERLENSPFSQNKYYSSAPVPTEDHIALLEEFEAILS